MNAVEEPVVVSKTAPDAIVLRPPPPPIVRFRRGMIIGLTAATSAGLMAVGFHALEPTTSKPSLQTKDVSRVHPGDAVMEAPASYDKLPKLVVPDKSDKPTDTRPAPPPADAVPHERDDPAALQRRAAQTAPVLVSLARGTGVVLPPPSGAPASPNVAEAQEEGQRRAAFAFATAAGPTVDPHRLVPPVSRWLLSAGSIISASLLTGIDSDLPGEITAQVTDPVFDSVTGDILLIPQGARLIGRNDPQVSHGQSRVLVAWQRLILPDGSSLELDSLPASDAAGYAGLSDMVDHHAGRLARGLALSTLLGVGAQLSIGSDSGSLARALRQSVQQGSNDVAGQFASRDLDVPPTIRVRPGWPVTIIVREDLLLKPWRKP